MPDPNPQPSEIEIVRRGVVAVISRADERMLIVRRSEFVAAPGKLCFPGGGIEEGEDEPTALCRELLEELRVQSTAGEYLWRTVTPWGVDLAFWTAEIAVGQMIEPDPAEVESVLWLSLDEMLEHPDLLESNREFLDVLRETQPDD